MIGLDPDRSSRIISPVEWAIRPDEGLSGPTARSGHCPEEAHPCALLARLRAKQAQAHTSGAGLQERQALRCERSAPLACACA